jgi:hypothetical protein
MLFPVVKGAAYALVHSTNMLIHQGTTQTSERCKNPNSEYLQKLPQYLRRFEDVVNYPPNQTYIGNLNTDELKNISRPWYENPLNLAARSGKYGEIMPENEFIGLLKTVDSFELVVLEAEFQDRVYNELLSHPILKKLKRIDKLTNNGATTHAIQDLVNAHQAQPLYYDGILVGCVKRAHEFDEALSAHVMLENLVAKASAVFVLKLLFAKTEIHPGEIDYIIECSEEAGGDMNQRGGGGFAKSVGEMCDCSNATGSDTRGFCAGPAHALIEAAALVQSGIYKNVVVLAGGSSSKLGMNAKDHVKKGLSVLEDMLGAFAIHIGDNDGVNPVIRTDAVGRLTIGAGGAPQAVITAMVTDPLDRVGYRISDIDCYAPELQNPEITEPAGAGDVPLANYKMIGALGVKRGEIAKEDMLKMVDSFGMPGFAPTQGHIPSGVPFIGHARDMIRQGKIKRAMIIGKGSLFLGRLTSLFDGVSFIIEENPGASRESFVQDSNVATIPSSRSLEGKILIGLTVIGSEHGPRELMEGAKLAQSQNPNIQVVFIGSGIQTSLPVVEAADEAAAHRRMDEMLENGDLDAAVTMHYNFPIGVSTVGRVVTPAKGKEMFIATTTGITDTNRVLAMTKNTLYGIATAKALGKADPSVGILNIDGARQVERLLKRLQEAGYRICFAHSARVDAGVVMRGNDLLQGVPDVMVLDSLTGNVMMKVLSAYSTGGNYEATGFGYGPGIGENYDKIICIISRASGAPTIAGAICFAADCVKGELIRKVKDEFETARGAGLFGLFDTIRHSDMTDSTKKNDAAVISSPTPRPVTDSIQGIEILDIEDAVSCLWKADIYAESGMGCTGPVIMVSSEDKEKTIKILKGCNYI